MNPDQRRALCHARWRVVEWDGKPGKNAPTNGAAAWKATLRCCDEESVSRGGAAEGRQNAYRRLSAFIGGEYFSATLAGPPVGGVRIRTEGFFASPVERHSVFEDVSRLRLGLRERGRHPAIAVVGEPVKVPPVVLIGDGILRLVAADVDVDERMGHLGALVTSRPEPICRFPRRWFGLYGGWQSPSSGRAAWPG